MPAFDAGDVVERLDWSFKPHVDAEGTVPEPSTEKVGAFFDQLRIILDRPVDETEDKTVQSVVAYLTEMSANEMLAADEKLIAAYADLCGDSPNADQIRALPHRQRQAFFGWITGQVVNPT